MARMRFNRQFNVNRVVKRLVRSVLALYVGGTIMVTFGRVMVNTTSPFYSGLTLIGWTVGAQGTNASGAYATTCGGTTYANGVTPLTTCITNTSGSGVLAVVGIIAIAQIITEFINW